MKIRNVLSGRGEASPTADVSQGEDLRPSGESSGTVGVASECGPDCGISAPPAQNIPEIEEDVIELTISEVDRQTASGYFDAENCLIGTALRNRGFKVQKVGGSFASLDTHRDHVFMDGVIRGNDLSFNYLTDKAPFYGPEVVGKVIRLRKVKP